MATAITLATTYRITGYIVAAVLFIRAEERNHLPEGAALVALPVIVAFWPVALAYLAVRGLEKLCCSSSPSR